MSKTVFFYVQHLWGVGHVYRATRIARGMARAGFDVHLIWGGTDIPGFDFSDITRHCLTPVRTSDASFSELLHGDGEVFTDDDKDKRCAELLALFDKINPDVVMTEAYPFGRRQMRFELRPLMERAKMHSPKPLVVSSIRDIMQEDRKPVRVEESNALVANYFDLIMVHGDEALIPIDATLQGVETFADKIRHTGLVVPDEPTGELPEEFKCDVLVTVGGGAFGQNLTRTALEAMQYSETFNSNWLISAGTELSQKDFELLENNCPKGMCIVRHIPNLALAMKHAKVSVSHAGYNTVGDVLRSGCASVLYPYTGGRETEQLRRSEIMQDMGIARMIEPQNLDPGNLAKAIDEAVQMQAQGLDLRINGADETARILDAELKAVSHAC